MNKTINTTNIPFIEMKKTSYKILTENNNQGIFVGDELKKIFKLSGIDIEAVTVYDENLNYISIGKTQLLNKSNINIDYNILKSSGYIIKTLNKNLLLIGKTYNSLLYACYELCEKVLGYKYYSYDEIAFDVKDKVTLPDFDYTDIPDFDSRTALSYEVWKNLENTDRLRLNGCYVTPRLEPNKWSSLSDTSLIDRLLPKSEFPQKDWVYEEIIHKDGIDYYAHQVNFLLGIKHKDLYQKGDMTEINYDDGRHGIFWTIVYRLIEVIKQEPNKTFFMLGMGDNDRFANDEESLAEYNKYTKSGVKMRFVNAIAREVDSWRKQKCPDREIILVSFAYNVFFAPPCKKDENGDYLKINNRYVPIDPSVVAEDNVMIRLAPIYANYMFDMYSDVNKKERDALIGWSSVASKLCIWDYRVDFTGYLAVFPQWMSANENYRIYKDLNVIDVMSQGARATNGTPLANMDNYARAKMLWDTTLDYNTLKDDFINNYYKSAAPCIFEYIEFLDKHYKDLYTKGLYDGYVHRYLTLSKFWDFETIQKIKTIFDKGFSILSKNNISIDDKIFKRLERESLFYRFMLIEHYSDHFNHSYVEAMINEFERIADEHGFIITEVGEAIGKKTATYLNEWKEKLNKGQKGA